MSTSCIEYSGKSRDKYGYAIRVISGIQEKAHRVAWMLHHGTIPPGLCVLHTCDNPPCVNINHLWLGTRAQNVQDMMNKHRHASHKGVDHPFAAFTDEDIIEIRRIYKEGNTSYAKLGRKYKVSEGAIAAIIKRRSWKHIP